MMPEQTLLLLAAVLVGVITGIYLCGRIHDHRVADLSAREYVAMHQMRDRTFRRVMPVLAIGTIVVVVAAAFSANAGTSRGLAIVAATLLCIDAVWTVRRQVPLNKLIQSWDLASIPHDWSQVRDRWMRQHNLRAWIAGIACTCLVIAATHRLEGGG